MILKCPLYPNPYYTYTIDLSDETYTLTFRYSSRSNGYLMDILDAEEEPVVLGVQLVPFFPLIEQYALEAIKGEFVLLPIEDSEVSNSGIPNPRRTDKTHQLLYID